MPFLRQQIEIVRPEVLVCLGRTAAQLLPGVGGVADFVGRDGPLDLQIVFIALLTPCKVVNKPPQLNWPKNSKNCPRLKPKLFAFVSHQKNGPRMLKPRLLPKLN